VIVFPEGGRSYSGATLEVKSGILGAAVLSQAQHPAEDVLLLPMAISYEWPPDASWFGLLLKGKKLRKRTQPFFKRLLGNILYFGADILAFGPFMLAPTTGKKYGKVFIDYGAPLPVRALLDLEADKATGTGDDFFLHRASMQKLGHLMHEQFVALYRLLPHHLLAAVLHDTPAAGISQAQAEKLVQPLCETLRAAGRNLKSVGHLTMSEIVRQGRQHLLRCKAISPGGTLCTVRNKRVIDYCAAPVLDKRAPVR